MRDLVRDLVIGVDASTTAVKAIVFDRAGAALAEAQRGYPLSSPQPGWFEQDPEDWWTALTGALGDITASIAPARIAGLCIGHQRETFTLIDEAGAALIPGILWLDERARPQVAELSARLGRERIRDISGKPPDPTPALYSLAWLREHDPVALKRARCVLDVHGFLAHRLTGRLATSLPSADPLGLVALAAGGWDDGLVAACGLRLDQLPALVQAGARLGEITERSAALTGLAPGTPVFAGGGDGQMGGLGVGAVDGSRAYLSLGSGIVCGVHSTAFRTSDAFRTLASPTGQGFMLETVLRSGMQLAEWTSRLVAGSAGQAELSRLDEAAAAITPGAEGLLMLPYFAGVMNPYWDERARGAVIGLSLSHTPAHLFRASLEALALEQGIATQALEAGLGRPITSFIASGGGTRSRVLPQVMAAVLDRPLAISPVREAVAVGAGVLAAVGAGLHGSVAEAIAAMVRAPLESIAPDAALRVFYAERLAVYRELFPALRPLFR
jgi:xylulokinase